MIRHIVFFTAKNKADIDRMRQGLLTLRGIPAARHLEVAVNERHDALAPDGVDLIVYAEFEGPAELAAYKAHPLYQTSIELVRPLRDLRVAADYEVPPVTAPPAAAGG
jgi:hypothetical protein